MTDNTLWAHAHGASTHFPIALSLSSAGLDLAGFALARRPIARGLHAAGFWMMIGGALGSVPAVFSGLLMTQGRVFGHGALRLHHWFVWPAFALLVGLATWRVCVRENASRVAFAGYLLGAMLAAALISAAGYWGGELMTAAN